MNVMPGAQPLAETRTYYVMYDDGALGQIESSGEPSLTRPGRLATEAEYQAALITMRAGTDEHLAALRAGDRARALADVQVLRSLGAPEESARRMANWNTDLFGEPEAAA